MTPERIERLTTVVNKRQGDITVLMEDIHDPHNISAVMRTCDAIGIMEIYVLNSKISTHKKFGTKSSSSALKWLKINQYEDREACILAIKAKYKKLYATYLHQDAKGLYQLDLTESVCLVFGNEKDGVSKELLQHCDGNFIIPQVGMIKSLNISVACAVSLYEAYRQKSAAGHYNKSRLSVSAYETLKEEYTLKAENKIE